MTRRYSISLDEILALRIPPDVDRRHLSAICGPRYLHHDTYTTIGVDAGHLDMSVANAQGAVIGGHVVDGYQIYTTAEITIGILPELQFQRVLNEPTGFVELSIEPYA
jgi:Plants and Prokaryotes Conserved (PCC) domain